MEHAAIALAAFLAAGVTFFSGFGLGTVLLPVFAAFLPTEAAIGATAVVHLLNNLLKAALLGRHVDRRVLIRFGLPALAAAPLGALSLRALSDLRPIGTIALAGERFAVTPVNVIVAGLLVWLGVRELSDRAGAGVSERFLVAGGAASGFLGGLAGLQGALRSAFLIRTGLARDAFIATGVAASLLVDVSRLAVYATQGTLRASGADAGLLLTGIAAASAGTIAGGRLLPTVTVRGIRLTVGVMLIAAAIALALGLV